METLDFEKEITQEIEGIIAEWAKDHPVVYMNHITRKYRKRVRESADSILGERVDYQGILREEWEGCTHVEKCTLVLYCRPCSTTLSADAFRSMIRDMILQFEKVKIEPGTMVGIQAAQSVGESMTQASLNTFHLAGAKRSMTTGITRLKELLNCTSQVPVPYFSNVNCRDPGALIEKRMKDIVVINKESPVVWDTHEDKVADYMMSDVAPPVPTTPTPTPTTPRNTPCRWQIRFTLKDPSWWPKIQRCAGIPEIVRSTLRCDPEDNTRVYTEFPYKTTKHDLFKRIAAIMDYHIEGVPGANEADGNTLFLQRYHRAPTLGDFHSMCPDLDLTKLRTNNIPFIYSTFGIEAVREYLVKEIKRVLGDEGIHVNDRHIMLIVDNMTYNGYPQANLYSAVNLQENAIMKATFQQHTETFASAAAGNVRDELKDVSSQVLMGKLPGVGAYGANSNVIQYEEVGEIVEREVGPAPPSPEYAPLEEPHEDNYHVPDGQSPEYQPSSPVYCPSSPLPAPASPVFIMPDLTI